MKTSRLAMLAVSLAVILAAYLSPANGQQAPVLRFIGMSTVTPPADSLAFRQAIAYAIDREAVLRAVLPTNRNARAAFTIQHPALPGYDPSNRALPYDPAKARELLGQSGWTAPITIFTGASQSAFNDAYFGALTNSIRSALGLPVNIQRVANFAALVAAVRNGTAAVYEIGWVSDARDFGYPSFALGIANNVVFDSEAKALSETKDIAATERLLLNKAIVVPVVFPQ